MNDVFRLLGSTLAAVVAQAAGKESAKSLPSAFDTIDRKTVTESYVCREGPSKFPKIN